MTLIPFGHESPAGPETGDVPKVISARVCFPRSAWGLSPSASPTQPAGQFALPRAGFDIPILRE